MGGASATVERLEAENEALRRKVAQLESSLRLSAQAEHLFRDFFDNAPIGKSMTAPDGTLMRVNPAFAAMLGRSASEMQSVSFAAITHPDDIAESRECIRALLAGERDTWTMEKRYLHQDGHYVWTMVTTRLQKDAHGAPLHFLTHIVDVSERKRAAQEVEDARASLEEAQRVAHVGSWEWDALEDRVSGSPEFYRLFELKPAALARFEDLVGALHPADVAPVRQAVADALAQRRPYEATYRVRTRLGGWRDILARGEPLLDRQGRPVRMVGTCADVSARLDAERRASREERKARAFLEGTKDLVTILDPEGRFLYVNGASRHFYAAEPEALVGRRAIDFVHPDDRQATQDSFAGWLAQRVAAASLENRQLRSDGAVVHALWTIMPQYRDDQAVKEVWSVARDITERKRDEEALQQKTAELERSNRELEQFAYVASHDLQEPLRMVASFTQLLARRYQDKLDQDARDFIGFAVDGANRMQRLIQDLLTYSRVTTRGLPLQPVDAHDALGVAVRDLQAAIQESGAMVTNGELPRVLADAGQLAQVFQNLVGNGIKFHKPGEPPRVHVSAERSPGRPSSWTFRVQDNGIGIEPRHVDRLFVIFQRLHGKQEYPGTGIGLALVKRIVERHGGKVWLESEPGKGTAVFFTLGSAV